MPLSCVIWVLYIVYIAYIFLSMLCVKFSTTAFLFIYLAAGVFIILLSRNKKGRCRVGRIDRHYFSDNRRAFNWKKQSVTVKDTTPKQIIVESESVWLNNNRQVLKVKIDGVECLSGEGYNCNNDGISESFNIPIPSKGDNLELTTEDKLSPVNLLEYVSPGMKTKFVFSYTFVTSSFTVNVIAPENVVFTGDIDFDTNGGYAITDIKSSRDE